MLLTPLKILRALPKVFLVCLFDEEVQAKGCTYVDVSGECNRALSIWPVYSPRGDVEYEAE